MSALLCPPDKGGVSDLCERGVAFRENQPPARYTRDPLVRGSAK
jgi:hypothetical protein